MNQSTCVNLGSSSKISVIISVTVIYVFTVFGYDIGYGYLDVYSHGI